MNPTIPPELKGFHVRNMFHAFLVILIPLGAWAWSYHRQEAHAADDQLQSVLHWIFFAGFGLFMLTILFKAAVSLPKCPDCKRKMVEKETMDMAQKPILGIKSSSRWRIVACPCCGSRYRIPGLSIG